MEIKRLQENLLFSPNHLDITNLTLRYNTLCKLWLGFLVAELCLNHISAPPSLHLGISIVCTVCNRLCINKFLKFKMRLVRATWQVGLRMAKMSLQKNYKLKPILITLQTTMWNVRHILLEVWCNFEHHYSFFCPQDNFELISSSIFRQHFACFFLEQL